MYAFAETLESEKPVVMRLWPIVSASPSLLRRQAEVREEWIEGLAEDVASREGAAAVTLEHQAVVLSAFGALSAAYDFWRLAGGSETLPELVDRAFRSIEGEVSSL